MKQHRRVAATAAIIGQTHQNLSIFFALGQFFVSFVCVAGDLVDCFQEFSQGAGGSHEGMPARDEDGP
jgi:hypothetical protein